MLTTNTDHKIIHGMSAADYHAQPRCSASKLKAMRRSPAHCKYQMDNPPTSEAMALGSLLHTMVLEPLMYPERYYIMPECDRRTKEGKATWAAAQIAAGDRIMPRKEEFELAYAMCRASRAHPAYSKLFDATGHNELSVFWRDEETGLDCKMRCDRIVEVPGIGTVCVDLKTTTDASPRAFARSVHKFGYHIQAGMYLEGLAKVGIPCDLFVIMAPESVPPHCVGLYGLKDETVAQGWRECQRLMRIYAECKRTGVWPGYADTIQKLDLPAWAFDDDEDEI